MRLARPQRMTPAMIRVLRLFATTKGWLEDRRCECGGRIVHWRRDTAYLSQLGREIPREVTVQALRDRNYLTYMVADRGYVISPAGTRWLEAYDARRGGTTS